MWVHLYHSLVRNVRGGGGRSGNNKTGRTYCNSVTLNYRVEILSLCWSHRQQKHHLCGEQHVASHDVKEDVLPSDGWTGEWSSDGAHIQPIRLGICGNRIGWILSFYFCLKIREKEAYECGRGLLFYVIPVDNTVSLRLLILLFVT